jgi:hypothetical protein
MMEDFRLCKCRCHREGMKVMHFSACCNRTYAKYLNNDGSENELKVFEIKREEMSKLFKPN